MKEFTILGACERPATIKERSVYPLDVTWELIPRTYYKSVSSDSAKQNSVQFHKQPHKRLRW